MRHPDGYAPKDHCAALPCCTRWVEPPDTYAQEEKGLIFPIMTKGLQDNGVGVNAQWIPEGVVLLPTLKQTSSCPFGMRRQVRIRLTRTHRDNRNATHLIHVFFSAARWTGFHTQKQPWRSAG